MQQCKNPPRMGLPWEVSIPFWQPENTHREIWEAGLVPGGLGVAQRVSHGTKILVSNIFSYIPQMNYIYEIF